MNNLLSFIGALMSLTTVYMYGSKRYHLAFVVSLCSDPLWFYIGLSSRLWGVAALAIATCVLNIRGLCKLRTK